MSDPFEPFHAEPYPADQPTQHLPLPQAKPPVWRRRGPLIGAGVAVLAVIGIVVGLVVAGGSGTPDNTANAQPAPAVSAPASTPASGHHKGKGAGKAAGKAAGMRVGAGEDVLYGTVSSVSGNSLAVSLLGPQGQVTVTTDANTKVTGSGVSALTDLKQGDKVQVLVKGQNAIAVRVVPGQ